MQQHYDPEEWRTGTVRGRQVFNCNYRMSGTELEGWQLTKVVTMQQDADTTEKVYLWQSKSDPEHEMVRVGVSERHDWRAAQDSLHEYLTHCTRPDIPRGTANLARLGDVAFVGRESQTDVPGAISFTRGNVLVSVSSVGEKTVDVSGIASLLDRVLGDPPAKRDVAKGRVLALAPKTATVEANQAQVLIKDLRKAAPRGEWLKVIVPDGELSRKGNALNYVSDKGGAKQVTTYVASSD